MEIEAGKKYPKGNVVTFPLELTQLREEQSAENTNYLYPAEVFKIQEQVEDACDRLEYDGSFMYDAYPDKVSLECLAKKVCEKCDCDYKSEISNRWFRALIQMMLCNEMSYRRRRRQCHKDHLGKCTE